MAAGQSVLAFRIADRRFALEAAQVSEVVRRPIITRVPLAPSSLAGVAALRGRVLPVVSLGALLGVDAIGTLHRLIVLNGASPIGLGVDEVIGLEIGQGGGLVETSDGAARMVQLDTLLESAFAEGFRRGKRRAPPERERQSSGQSEAMASFLAFELASQPYALSLDAVREVIATPPEVAALPRTDAAMLGVASLRGALTPIVSTRALLGLAPAPLDATSRVIVASVGDASIGFAVDRMTAIVHAPPSAIGPVPKVLNRGAGEAQVAAMLRVASGGLISVLDPERLFAEESVAQILEDGRSARVSEKAEAEGEAQTLQRFLIFQLGEETYGLDVEAVDEVAALPEKLAQVPRAPDYLLGMMSLRGAPVPVIDQRRRFGLGETAAAGRPRVIVARVGELIAGFAVDAVSEILELPAERLSSTPELTQDAARLFDRVAQADDGGRVILMVNPREMLDRAEQNLMAALAADTPAS